MFIGAVIALALLAASAPAQAAYPERPIKIVVDFAPGSSTDIVARLIGVPLQASLVQTVVVENKPGAGGNIATPAVIAAPAYGYSLLIHSVAYAVNPSLFANAGYCGLADLQPVAIAAVTPKLIYLHPDVKARTLAELLALARAQPQDRPALRRDVASEVAKWGRQVKDIGVKVA